MTLWAPSEFTSLFRLLDDYDVHRSGRDTHTSTIRAFRPKFDVVELDDVYKLHGELPGISQKDINMEFVDPHTLVIAGHVERSSTRSSQEEPSASGEKSSEKSSRKTVEGQKEYKFWVSERSVGEFHRSFTFPSSVNQDGVTAGLKDGILEVTVPKHSAPVAKRIRID